MISILSTVLLAITPWLLKVITNAVKSAESIKFAPDRVWILRFGLAVLAFVAALVNAILSGEPVPQNSIEMFVDAIRVFVEAAVLWLATTGLYFIKKH